MGEKNLELASQMLGQTKTICMQLAPMKTGANDFPSSEQNSHMIISRHAAVIWAPDWAFIMPFQRQRPTVDGSIAIIAPGLAALYMTV